jgi:hypothetical protein
MTMVRHSTHLTLALVLATQACAIDASGDGTDDTPSLSTSTTARMSGPMPDLDTGILWTEVIDDAGWDLGGRLGSGQRRGDGHRYSRCG